MRAQAIIIKKIPIREYDELVVCYTPHEGKQTYQARSVRRRTSKQASHLDIMNLVDFTLVPSNGYSIVTQAHSLKAFANLKSRLPSLALGYFLLECFDKLIFEGQADQKLWDFLIARLDEYNRLATEENVNWSSLVNSSRQNLLQILGYAADIQPDGAAIEELAGSRLNSLQFAKKMIK